MKLALLMPVLLAAAVAGCAARQPVVEPPPVGPEAVSLLGSPLAPPALSDEIREDREAKLAEARAVVARNPDDPEAIIWHGRRTAYLGRYRAAVEIYTAGIERHPGDARLYRHRGHRYISLRDFPRAVADLERASALIAGVPDEVEPDGLPNARNQPTSTSHSNIWYHLGLAYYLQGDFENAERCYRECMKFSTNPDMLSATSHWLYMTLRRLGRDEEATALLEPIHEGMDIIENRAYHELLLMYKGLRTPQTLLGEPASADDALSLATTGYGVANWYLYNGREAAARLLFRRIVGSPQWAAFGFIAAEAELARAAR